LELEDNNMEQKQQLAQRAVTWFARYVAALSAEQTVDAEDCRRHLASLGVWVESHAHAFDEKEFDVAEAASLIREVRRALKSGDGDKARQYLETLREAGFDLRLGCDCEVTR
jgi:hypothetical protein